MRMIKRRYRKEEGLRAGDEEEKAEAKKTKPVGQKYRKRLRD